VAVTLDPEVAAALAPIAAATADVVPPPVGDVESRRPAVEAVMAETAALQPRPTDVKTTDFKVTTDDRAQALLHWYVENDVAESAALYLHGSGMVHGNTEVHDGPVSRYVSSSGVSIPAVECRVAPEHLSGARGGHCSPIGCRPHPHASRDLAIRHPL
jgi:acetyl esterase/lipase